MFSKFVGITQELSALIEARRTSPEQSENDILLACLRPPNRTDTDVDGRVPYDLGQGVTVYVGEHLMLFLEENSKKSRKPDGVAEVRVKGIFVDGKKVERSRGSEIAPAMHYFQKKLDHRNESGDLISLNAYLKWHVVRDDKMLSLVDLKDPAKARKRGRGVSKEAAEKFLADLGLVPRDVKGGSPH